MYTLSPNEKLGMQVEQVRLAEIRQQIEAGRLGSEVQGKRFGLGALVLALSTFVAAHKAELSTELSEQSAIGQKTTSQTN